MNANELADELDDIDAYEKHQTLLGKASETLRQQQAEIEALKLKKVTEGEILNIYLCLTNGNKDLDLFEFAEEILRKAERK